MLASIDYIVIPDGKDTIFPSSNKINSVFCVVVDPVQEMVDPGKDVWVTRVA